MQTVSQIQEVLVIRVDEVEELFGQELRSRAQFSAQVFKCLMAVAQGGEICGGDKVGSQKVAAL